MKLSNWFEKQYLQWQISQGRATIEEFSKYLGISRSYLSLLLNGERTNLSRETAFDIANKLNDYEILSILGYALPADNDDSPDQEMTKQKEELLYKFDQLNKNDRQTILDMMEFLLSK